MFQFSYIQTVWVLQLEKEPSNYQLTMKLEKDTRDWPLEIIPGPISMKTKASTTPTGKTMRSHIPD